MFLWGFVDKRFLFARHSISTPGTWLCIAVSWCNTVQMT